MKKLLYKATLDWKGTENGVELYESDDISDLGFVSQCQAISFVDEDNIVLFKHIDGYYSLAGGKVEKGESFEKALKREIMEESACEVLESKIIGYVKVTEVPSGKVVYQLRYVAKVRPLDQPVQDPDGKAMERRVVGIDEANEILGWGERGQILLDLAKRKYKE